MKKAAVVMAAAAFLFVLAAPAAFATHRPGHQEPPACQNSQGSAQEKNKHCAQYPPSAQSQGQSVDAKNKSFQFPAQANDGSVTVGMLIVAGLGAFTVLVAARGVRRRLIH